MSKNIGKMDNELDNEEIFRENIENVIQLFKGALKQDIIKLANANGINEEVLEEILSKNGLGLIGAPHNDTSISKVAEIKFPTGSNTKVLWNNVLDNFDKSIGIITSSLIPAFEEKQPNRPLTIGFFGFDKDQSKNDLNKKAIMDVSDYNKVNGKEHLIIVTTEEVDTETIKESLDKNIYDLIIVGSTVGTNYRFFDMLQTSKAPTYFISTQTLVQR